MIRCRYLLLLTITYTVTALLGTSSAYSPAILATGQRWHRTSKCPVLAGTRDSELTDEIDHLITMRSEARSSGDYATADAIMEQIQGIELPSVVRLLIEDIPRAKGGGSTWKLFANNEAMEMEQGPTVLQMAHMALGNAASMCRSETAIDSVVDRAIQRLRNWKTVQDAIQGDEGKLLEIVSNGQSAEHICLPAWNAVDQELRGRKAADAAFWFALAGSKDTELFDLLAEVCYKEIMRFRDRPSCRIKDLLAILDRLAIAGVRHHPHLEKAVQEVATDDQSVSMDMHSERCALKIWKFSTKQKKQASFLSTAVKHWEQTPGASELPSNATQSTVHRSGDIDWSTVFNDPHRPLIIDVGCGYGVSLLGLSNLPEWSDCNLLGADLSSLATGYASGIAHRWGMDDRLNFLCADVQQLLPRLLNYPGEIRMIMIQFPTPYRLEEDIQDAEKTQGNTQLPKSPTDGFMVSLGLLETCRQLLGRSGGHGSLLLQSNCEDVAVYMRNMAMGVGFGLCTESFRASIDEDPTQRGQRYIAMGGDRALGEGWEAGPVLPPKGRTETEIACILNGTPVHRARLRVPVI